MHWFLVIRDTSYTITCAKKGNTADSVTSLNHKLLRCGQDREAMVAFGTYIWNADQSFSVFQDKRLLQPLLRHLHRLMQLFLEIKRGENNKKVFRAA